MERRSKGVIVVNYVGNLGVIFPRGTAPQKASDDASNRFGSQASLVKNSKWATTDGRKRIEKKFRSESPRRHRLSQERSADRSRTLHSQQGRDGEEC